MTIQRPDESEVVDLIAEIVDGLQTPHQRFLALWRQLPDRVSTAFGREAASLPADTRLPDHTLFQHADTAVGMHTALAGSRGSGLLSFTLGPVQTFIAAAQSVRDLWTGSAIISWLAFQAMRPILDAFGPTAFVYPALRGAPLADLWLSGETLLGERVRKPDPAARMAPSLPNRFLALVPWGADGRQASACRDACRESARTAWRRLGDAVRERLDPSLAGVDPDWATRWRDQIDGTFDFRCTVAPIRDLNDEKLASLVGASSFADAWPHAARIRELGDALPAGDRPAYSQDHAGRWQAQTDYSGRLLAAERSVRLVPDGRCADGQTVPAKCSLLGSWEQLGPAEFAPAASFWGHVQTKVHIGGVRLRERERLCAVALAKRFAGPVLLACELHLSRDDLRFPDTATVAAARWLARAGIDPDGERCRYGHWSGQWLHWSRPAAADGEPSVPVELWKRVGASKKRLGPPPAYYAVLVMDGDRMGQWLAGKRTPPLRAVLHPKSLRYFEELGDPGVESALDALRPVSPALHTTISSRLARFATKEVPEILDQRHSGTVIYSGGDDVLALCPLETSLACLDDLRSAFASADCMGSRATLSAGLAIVHYKEDLRLALEAARRAEKDAKNKGRNQLRIVTIRRSGEETRAFCPWQLVTDVDRLRDDFVQGASPGWTYKLREELPMLAAGLPSGAVRAEIGRLVARSSGAAEDGRSLKRRGCEMGRLFDALESSHPLSGDAEGSALEHFVALCQTAAFMARGHDV